MAFPDGLASRQGGLSKGVPLYISNCFFMISQHTFVWFMNHRLTDDCIKAFLHGIISYICRDCEPQTTVLTYEPYFLYRARKSRVYLT